MNIGVVGNRSGISQVIVRHKLDLLLEKYPEEPITIVSGGAAGVDSYAEQWASHAGIKRIIYKARENNRIEYFKRNGQIAEKSDIIIAFIKKHKLRSGTWNTIKQFIDMGKTDYTVYDEAGKIWNAEDFPEWLKGKLS